MARILPDEPLGLSSPEALRVFRLLRDLPDGWVVWQCLSMTETVNPDFWILREKDFAPLFLVVSRASEELARGPGLFSRADEEPFGAAEERRILAIRERLADVVPDLRLAVCAPNVPDGLATPGRIPAAAGVAGKESCRPKGFLPWVESLLGEPLPVALVQALRERLTPEAVVAPAHAMRQGAGAALLTYRQEELLKSDLSLSCEARETAGEFGLLLVNGVAGSGKSLILLQRALLLRRFFPHSRVLVLTNNKPLQLELRRRFEDLGGTGTMVEWSTFHGFCLRHWPDPGTHPSLVDRKCQRELLEEAQKKVGGKVKERRQLEEEFSWIFEQGFESEESYQAAHRKGRGFRTDEALRHELWEAAQGYRGTLGQQGLVDFALLPLEFRNRGREEGAALPRFDAVLVDEAQFFAPVWFEVIRQVLSPQGHLFLVADPTQGFLSRGGSWKAQGLNVHGKVKMLDRSHRATRPILEAAWRFWTSRSTRPDPDVIAPRLEGMPEGPAPLLEIFPNEREEMAWVLERVTEFVNGGGDPRHVLVLHEDWKATRELVDRLREILGETAVADARDPGAVGNAVRVCTLNAATGLESPVVFVLGTHRLFDREGSWRLDADVREKAAQEATRKLYMAFTRAGQRLLVTHVGAPPPSLAYALAFSIPTG